MFKVLDICFLRAEGFSCGLAVIILHGDGGLG